MNRSQLNADMPSIVEALVRSVQAHPALQHLNRVYLPNRSEIITIIDLLQQIVYPGYFGKQGLTTENLPFRIGEVALELNDLLFEQVRCCLRYREHLVGPEGHILAEQSQTQTNSEHTNSDPSCADCDEQAAIIVR